ncbi:sigma-70 family RNA polymerase sigma factor [Reichenbachiella sp.]|uniref:RNA polymerase sigma factor n=1 Tax=Reichenbachiella sp. TaxID=2184521 RepID=UPI00329951DF
MKTISLEQIRAELATGNNDCLKVIFDNYALYCVGLLIKKTGCSEEDAEDILMDAVLNFREKVMYGQIEYLTNLKAYLFSTCHRMWLARYNKEKMQRKQLNEVYDELYDNDMIISRKENHRKISFQALNRLGDKCKTLLTLFYIENKRMTEIAEIMGFTGADVAKTSKSRCFKKLLLEVDQLQKNIKDTLV